MECNKCKKSLLGFCIEYCEEHKYMECFGEYEEEKPECMVCKVKKSCIRAKKNNERREEEKAQGTG